MNPDCKCRCHTAEYRTIKIPGSSDTPAARRDLERSVKCLSCACGDVLVKTSRRGFISMLGAGLALAAVPKLIEPEPLRYKVTERFISRAPSMSMNDYASFAYGRTMPSAEYRELLVKMLNQEFEQIYGRAPVLFGKQVIDGKERIVALG